MGRLVAGYASSHAFTFMDPSEWDGFRARIADGYKRRYGVLPPDNPKVDSETLEDNQARFARIREALDEIKRRLAADRPDALVVIGDDQDENFDPEFLLPQIAVYTGPDFGIRGRLSRFQSSRERPELRFRSHPDLANAIVEAGIAEGFDIAVCHSLKENTLTSHAHYQILEDLVAEADIPVVLVYVNALHQPAPSPGRCFNLGQMLTRAIAGRPEGERVAVYGSGGLSHFTAGYPWRHYQGPYKFGDISTEFDRDVIIAMEAGEGARLATLGSEDLLNHGNIELRSWISVLGSVGDARPDLLVYEPFFRAIQGMAVGAWRLDGAST